LLIKTKIVYLHYENNINHNFFNYLFYS